MVVVVMVALLTTSVHVSVFVSFFFMILNISNLSILWGPYK